MASATSSYERKHQVSFFRWQQALIQHAYAILGPFDRFDHVISNLATKKHKRHTNDLGAKIDSCGVSVIVCGAFKPELIFLISVWVPHIGENREAGVNPARSRHCDEKL